MTRMRTWWVCAGLAGGCGGDARVELAAADAIGAVAGQMERTLQEYHEEVSRYDDTRESSVVSAFVARLRKDAADETAVDAHAADFAASLRQIRGDRETEWSRRATAMENVGVLREMARGVQKLAFQSLGLQDEMRRYFEGWIAAGQKAQGRMAAHSREN